MIQVFTLDVDAGAAEVLGQTFSERQWCWTAGVRTHQVDVLVPECRIITGGIVSSVELRKRGLQDFGDERTAEFE